MTDQRCKLQEVCVEPLASGASLIMDVLQMPQETSLVLLPLSTSWTHRMDSLHMLDQLIRHLKHLFTKVTRQKLTRGLMLPIMDPQIELLAEGDLALPALELVLPFNGHMFIPDMVLHQGQVMGRIGTLVAIVPMTDIIVVNEGVQLVLGGRDSAVLVLNSLDLSVGLHGVLVIVLGDEDLTRLGLFPFWTRFGLDE